MIIARECSYCQEVYDADTRYLNRGQGQFCSRRCSGLNLSSKPKLTHDLNVQCSWCGELFYRSEAKQSYAKTGHLFCSKEHQNLAYADPTHPLKPGPKPTGRNPKFKSKVCPECKKRHENKTEWCKKCDTVCRIKLWLSGDNSVTFYGGRSQETRKFVKKYLIETRGDKCEQCGWDEKSPDGRSIIQIDHIDGNCHNNDLNNLQLLCPNHHAMTLNYGSLNKGSGRTHRRKADLQEEQLI